MKKYVKPMLQAEEFVPQEYVATCYVIKCSLPSFTAVYWEDNGYPGLQKTSGNYTINGKSVYVSNPDTKTSGRASGCGTPHYGVLVDPEKNAYYTTSSVPNPTEPNCFQWNAGTDRKPDYHASKLEPGDVDTSNPRSSE